MAGNNRRNNNKGKRPLQRTPSVEDITDLVDALAARHGVSRNAAIRMLANQPGTSSRHAGLGSSAAQRVLNSRNLAQEIAGRIASRNNLARFGAVTRSAREAQQRLLRPDPFFQPVRRRTTARHTKASPYQGRPWQRKQWLYGNTRGAFCTSVTSRFLAKYPTKASLLARLRELPGWHRVSLLRLRFSMLEGDLKRVLNGVAMGCLRREYLDELQRFLHFLMTHDGRWWRDPSEVERFVRRAERLSYHALYIVMALLGALS